MEKEFPVATVSALLRPAATQRVLAATSGKFRLAAVSGQVAAGDVLGRFDDAELRAALDTARLRLRAAQQVDSDFVANAPARREEAQARVTDLESRLALAEAAAKNPSLLRDLPPAVQTSLAHANPAGLRAQLDAAKSLVARLDAPGQEETSTPRLQVLEAERTVRELELQLRDAVVTAPFAGIFQPGPTINGTTAVVPLSAGQEIGTIRDLTKIVGVVPALSPYLVRVEIGHTVLRVLGPGGRPFTARYREALTEASPVMGEARVFLYEFSEADSREIAGMVQTNADAHVVLVPAEPVAVVLKLDAALKFPNAFRDGWLAGVAKAWPGWTLACEGENALGLTPAGR